MDPKIDVTVAAVVPDGDRYLLVEERVGGQLVFNQPAGHLEPNESLTSAIIRETREETGFLFEPEFIIGIYLWHSEAADRSFLRVTFAGSATAPERDVELDDGIVGVHWLSRNQLLSPERRLRSPMVLRCIDDYERGDRLIREAFDFEFNIDFAARQVVNDHDLVAEV